MYQTERQNERDREGPVQTGRESEREREPP